MTAAARLVGTSARSNFAPRPCAGVARRPARCLEPRTDRAGSGPPVIQGTGGCRKARAARGDPGKSGGVRIIYLFWFWVAEDTVHKLAVYAKTGRTISRRPTEGPQ